MMTEPAFFRMKAASSALPDLTSRSPAPAPAAAAPLSVPNPPRITWMIDRVLPSEGQRPARDQPLQFGKSDDRAGKGDRADCQPDRHLDKARRVDRAADADTVGLRRGEGRRRNAHRGEADQAVEGGNQLRQRRHLDLPRDIGAN